MTTSEPPAPIETGASARAMVRRLDEADRRTVALVTLALVVLGALHSLVTPLHRGPDETQHHDMIVHVLDNRSWPDPGDRPIDYALRRSRDASQWDRRADRRELGEQHPRGQRPTWGDLDRIPGDRSTRGRNPATQHPFLYYALEAPAWALLKSDAFGLPFDRAVVGLRLTTLLFTVPLPLLVLLLARRVGLQGVPARTAVILTLAVPQLVHIGALVNNDPLLTLLGSAFLVSLAGVLRGRLGARHAATVGGLLGLALLTKGFALLWLPLATAAYAWVTRRRSTEGLAPAILALVTATAVGGWWWIRNMVLYATLQPRPLTDGAVPAGPPEGLDVWIEAFGHRFVDGFWGNFGTLDAAPPRGVTIVAWLALLAALGAGLARLRSRRSTATDESSGSSTIGVVDALLLCAISGGVAVATIVESLRRYLGDGLARGMQGRYAHAGIAALLVLAALGLHRLAGRRARTLAVTWVVVAQVGGVVTMLWNWYGPRAGPWSPEAALRALSSWLAWSPASLAAVAVVIAGLAVAAVWATTETARDEGARSDGR